VSNYGGGKPRPEQGQIGKEGWLTPLDFRVGRAEPAGNCPVKINGCYSFTGSTELGLFASFWLLTKGSQ